MKAREGQVTVLREPQATAELVGFSEAVYGREAKACFYGSVTDVCSQAKRTVQRLNSDLAMAGASQRFKIEACAHNPGKAMILYSLASKRNPAQASAEKQKSLFVAPCANGEIRKIAISFTE